MKYKYRDKTRIVYEILRYLSSEDTYRSKNKIVTKINVSYQTLVRYIYQLEDSGAIQTIQTTRTTEYRITEKGRQLLRTMMTIYEMLGEKT